MPDYRTANPVKPRYQTPCNGCGICCTVSLCEPAELALGRDATAPCPFLQWHNDRAWCGLVLAEQAAFDAGLLDKPRIAMSLGIGLGCDMEDDYA